MVTTLDHLPGCEEKNHIGLRRGVKLPADPPDMSVVVFYKLRLRNTCEPKFKYKLKAIILVLPHLGET